MLCATGLKCGGTTLGEYRFSLTLCPLQRRWHCGAKVWRSTLGERRVVPVRQRRPVWVCGRAHTFVATCGRAAAVTHGACRAGHTSGRRTRSESWGWFSLLLWLIHSFAVAACTGNFHGSSCTSHAGHTSGRCPCSQSWGWSTL